MELTVTAMDRDDDVTVETNREEMAAKRKASKMAGWQVSGRGAIIFNTTEEMTAFSVWLTGNKASHSRTRYCHYCGRPATGYGPFGEPACGECGGRD